MNRRLIAFILAFAFVLTTLVVGINFRTRAVTGTQVMVDDVYSSTITIADYPTFENSATGGLTNYFYNQGSNQVITATVTLTVSQEKISDITIQTNPANYSSVTPDQRKYLYSDTYNRTNSGHTYYYQKGLNVATQVYDGKTEVENQLKTNTQTSVIGKDATFENISSALSGSSDTGHSYSVEAYDSLKNGILEMVLDAPLRPKEIPEPDIVDPYVPSIPESAEAYLELNKTISPSATEKAYDLTLDAYSTANIRSYSIKEKKPTDYVIVIDQSGSMAHEDMPTNYKAAGNLTLEQIAEESQKSVGAKQYYYNDGENTYRVFADRGYLYEYFPPDSKDVEAIVLESDAGFNWFNNQTAAPAIQNQYYYQTDDGVFRPVTVSVQGVLGAYYLRLTYPDDNGNSVPLLRGEKPSYKPFLQFFGYPPDPLSANSSNIITQGLYETANDAVNLFYSAQDGYTYSEVGFRINGQLYGINTGMYVNHPLYRRHVGYTRLLYRDKNGNIQVVPTKDGLEQAEYCDSNGNALTTKDGSTNMEYSGLLEGKDYVSRLSSLNTALQYFAQTLQHDIDSFGIVDNRVAIAGFSSENSNNYNYNNTELLTGVTLFNGANESNSSNRLFPQGHNVNGPQYYENNGNYGDIDDYYDDALIDATVKNQNGSYAINPDFLTSINALTAYGGTQPEDGLVMAKNIYDARTEEERMYTWRSGDKKGQSEERNKVVIFFTDGQPGNYSNSNQYLEANEVVEAAYDLKHYTNPGDDEEVPASIFSIGVFGVSDGDPLTYEAHDVSTPKADYEYESGYFYKYDTTSSSWWLWWETTNTNTHYLNRYWHTGEAYEYGDTPTDTIYDYMSVVSSQYPDATKFIADSWRDKLTDNNTPENHSDGNNYSDWLGMIDYVRGDKDPDKNYYRLAANPESLVDAFINAASAVESEENQEAGSISEDTVLRDVIDTSNFKVTDDTTVEIQVIPSTKQTNDSDIVEGSPIIIDVNDENELIDYYWTVDGNNQKTGLVVSGFDYNLHHIAHTNNANGQKIRVIIKGVVPKEDVTGTNLTSNTDASGIYSDDTVEADMLKEFPIPAIARQKYALNVDTEDVNGVFDINYSLTANPGVTADFSNILISSGLNRELYSSGTLKSRNDVGNGDTVYLEYITTQGKNGVVEPGDYSLNASVNPNNSAYTYYLSNQHFLYDTDQNDQTEMNAVSPIALSTTSNGNLYVTSTANTQTVTIQEFTTGEFANKERAFKIGLNITKNNQPWSGTVQATINGTNQTLTFVNGNLDATSAALVALADSQTMTLEVPADAVLTLSPEDAQLYSEGVTYHKGSAAEVDPGASTTIDQNGIVFTVTYTREPVTDTGISDNDSSYTALLIVAAGMVVLAGGGTLVYFKKRETE